MVQYKTNEKIDRIGPERRKVKDRRQEARRKVNRRSGDVYRCLECEYCDQHYETQDKIHYQDVKMAEHGKCIEVADKKIASLCKEVHDLRDWVDEKIEAVEADAKVEHRRFVQWKPFILLMTLVFSAYAGPLAYGVLKMDSIEDNLNKLTKVLTSHLEAGKQNALVIDAKEKMASIKIDNNNEAIMKLWQHIQALEEGKVQSSKKEE